MMDKEGLGCMPTHPHQEEILYLNRVLEEFRSLCEIFSKLRHTERMLRCMLPKWKIQGYEGFNDKVSRELIKNIEFITNDMWDSIQPIEEFIVVTLTNLRKGMQDSYAVPFQLHPDLINNIYGEQWDER